MLFKLNWTAEKQDHGKLLREFLAEHEISRSGLADIKFKGGALSVNGEKVTVRRQLKEGEQIEVLFPPEHPSAGMEPESMPLRIVYEDDFILIVDKPSGMNTIPSREHPFGSLANGLLGYYREKGIAATIHIVTRLDRDTTGLVLIAKHSHVHHLLSKQQRAGNINRTYEALAEGVFAQEQGVIEEPIARKKDSIIEREVHPSGQYACTVYKVLKQYPEYAHVRLKLMTGRTHQIRVHLSYLGHPLIGDNLYGGNVSLLARQALHCSQIRFFHPITGERLEFSIELPTELADLL